MSIKRSHIVKQTCSWMLQVYLSMCDLLLDIKHERVKINVLRFSFVCYFLLHDEIPEHAAYSFLNNKNKVFLLFVLLVRVFFLSVMKIPNNHETRNLWHQQTQYFLWCSITFITRDVSRPVLIAFNRYARPKKLPNFFSKSK